MSKKTSIFNKGTRSFQISDDVTLRAGSTASVDADVAKKLLKTYPLDIVVPRGDAVAVDTSELEAEIKRLTDAGVELSGQHEALGIAKTGLDTQVEDLTALNGDLTKQVEDLTAELEKATAPEVKKDTKK